MRLFITPAALLLTLALTGCALTSVAPSPALNISAGAISGNVHGGQQPVVGATITVYAAGSSGYGTGATALATATTVAGGGFSIAPSAITCPAATTPIYITATGGNPGLTAGTNNTSLALIAALGPCATAVNANVTINEVTTAATVFSLAHFMGTTLGASGTANLIGGTCTSCAAGVYNQGLVAAFNNTVPQLANIAAGTALTSSTAGTLTITRESAKLNTIANALAACVNTTGSTSATETTTICGQLFGFTAPASGTRPSDTIQAALRMALIPYQNVSSIYNLSVPSPPFVGLGSTPNDWTIGIGYSSSSFGFGVNQGTTASIDIDASGRVWFPTNATAATSGVGYLDPASATFNGPYLNASLTHPQYVVIDSSTPANVYATDIQSANVGGFVTTSPATVTTLSGGTSTQGGPAVVNSQNALFFTVLNTPTSTWKVYTSTSSRGAATSFSTATYMGRPTSLGIYPGDTSNVVAPTFSGTTCYVENLTSTAETLFNNDKVTESTACMTGGYLPYESAFIISTSNQLCSQNANNALCYAAAAPLSTPQAVEQDAAGMVYAANAGNGSVGVVKTYNQTLTPVPYLHNASNGGTATTPYGLAIDRSSNVWMSNAGCVGTVANTPCAPGAFLLTEIVGLAGPAYTPFVAADNLSFAAPTQ